MYKINYFNLFLFYVIILSVQGKIDETVVPNSTFVVYGEVYGKNTEVLLNLNSNNPTGTNISVKVFNRDSKKLMWKSEPQAYDGGVVDFGVIELD